MVQKVSGRLQEPPRSPPDPIKKYLCVRKILYFSTYIFLLPIVLPIELPIELPINRLGGRYVPGPRPGPGQGAGAGTPWARGRGRDPLGQGPGGPWAQDVDYAWRV